MPIPLIRALVAIWGSRRRWDPALWQAAALLRPPEIALVAAPWSCVRHARVRIGVPGRTGPARRSRSRGLLRHATSIEAMLSDSNALSTQTK